MLRYRTSLLALAVVLLSLGAVSAAATDPFRDCDPIHEIGLARLADEAGDAVLAAALVLGPEASRERALLAIRATPLPPHPNS